MKTVLITGASRGIGYELARKLAADGHFVIATASTKEGLEKLQAEYPENIHIVVADLCNEKDREKIVSDIQKKFKKIDCLVNNAAIITPLASLENVSQEELTKILTVNVIAPVMLTNQLLPYLKDGRVLDVSSPASYMPLAGLGPYNISKAALAMATQVHQIELKLFNIKVLKPIPGEVDTDMHDKLRKTSHPIAVEFRQAKASGSLMEPRVSAAYVAWLAVTPLPKDFETRTWSIYDPSHHRHWLKGDMLLPSPIRKEQQGLAHQQEFSESSITLPRPRL